MLYNLELTPRQNRIHDQETLTPREVGIPIYPKFSKNEKWYSYSNIVYNDKNIYNITSDITWLNSSNILFTLFVDKLNYIVVVDLDKRTITKKLIQATARKPRTASDDKRSLTVRSVVKKQMITITMCNGREVIVDPGSIKSGKQLELFYPDVP